MMANSNSGESVIERIVRLLGAFDASHAALTATDLARRSLLPMSTAHRIVGELVQSGLLERDVDGAYRIGMRLWELTTRGSRALALRQAALPHMERVQQSVGQHTQLGVLDHDTVLMIERLSAPASGPNVARVAGRLPLHASSSGLALLAFGPESRRRRVLGGTLRAVAPGTITDPELLRRRLAAIRRAGYVTLPASIDPASTGIAVPVIDRTGATVAALSVVVPFGWAQEAEAVTALREAAEGISIAIAEHTILSH